MVVPSACLPYRLITKPINIHRARSKCVIYVGGHSATNDSRTNSAHPGISIDRPRIWGLKLSAQSISPPRHQPATLIWRDLIFLDRSSNGGLLIGRVVADDHQLRWGALGTRAQIASISRRIYLLNQWWRFMSASVPSLRSRGRRPSAGRAPPHLRDSGVL